MVHAFNIVSLIDKFSYHIESIDSWENASGGSQLVIGTTEGLLLRFTVTDAGGRGAFVATQVDALRFSKKPINQINVVEEYNIMISLADGYISVHELPTFRLRCQLSKTKDCHLYTIDKSRNNLFLCAAVKKKIIIYELEGVNFIEKRELGLPDVARCMVFCGPNLCIGFKKDYTIINLNSGSISELFPTGKSGPPIATVLPSSEILLELDNLSIFVGYDGKPTKKYGLTWSETPTALSYSFPYVIAILSKYLEVRAVFGSQKMVQTLALRGLKLITQKKEIYVAHSQAVWRLVPVPLITQIINLENDRKFKQALSLAENVSFNSEEEKKEKIRHIKIARAYNQFAKRRFGPALNIFYELNFDPLRVIGLYPDLLPKSIRSGITYPISMPELEGPVLDAALQQLINYLTQKRATCQPDPKSRNDDYALTKDLAEIIDTALLKAYLKTNDALVAPLLRLPNHCHVRECEIVLTLNKKYIELVLLYKSKGLHQSALELLTKLGQAPRGSNPLSGTSETIKYLKSLGKDHLDLILNFSKWVLAESPEDALAIFTEERSSDDQLPPARILDHIKQCAPKLSVPYLEFLIHERGDKNAEFHNELIFSYLSTVATIKKQDGITSNGTVPAGTEPGLLGRMRRKLLEFLDKSKFYNPERMLSRFPSDDLYEERAVLLSRIGQHDLALGIYAHKIGNFRMAEDYCEKHYSPTSEEARDVYLSLLRVYLQPPDGKPPMLAPALQLLNKHYTRINAPKALELFPPNTSLQQLLPFLESVVRDNTKNRRNNQVVKNLLRTESLQVRFQHMKARSRMIKIYEGRICPVCNKRLGTSVFACYPNGVVVHFICFKDKNVCPVTGTRFNKETSSTANPQSKLV